MHAKDMRSLNVRRSSIPLLLAALLLSVVGFNVIWNESVQAQEQPSFISIGTASAAGAYYPLGVAMADMWGRAMSEIHFSAQVTGGGVDNLNRLGGAQLEVGIANENIGYDAALGNSPFDRPIDLVGGWVLNKSMGLFVAKKSSGIQSVADLRGKRVSLGSPGSSANVLGKLVLESQGLTEEDYSLFYLGWQQSADAINDGLLDAAFMVGGQPFPAIQSLAVRTPITVLDFDEERLDAYAEYPYATDRIPRAMYETDEPGEVVLVRSIIYLRPDLPEETVYEMVRTVFENVPTLKAAHSSGDQADLFSKADAEALGLTVHPGAKRYAEEVGEW